MELSDGLLSHRQSRLAAHLAVGSVVMVGGCGADREVGSPTLSFPEAPAQDTQLHGPPLGLGPQENPFLSPPIALTLLGPASTCEPLSHPSLEQSPA